LGSSVAAHHQFRISNRLGLMFLFVNTTMMPPRPPLKLKTFNF
jgi:hypothetical protein